MAEGKTDPYAQTALSDRPPAPDPHPDTDDASGERPRSAEEQARPDPLIGRQLAHFRIDAPLGRGGMGAVYRGWDTALERPVAIKVLTVSHPQARIRFLREARAQARVRHPNVVPIHFVGEDGETVFLSMDLVEGESVADRLDAGRIPVDDALDMVDAVARALAEGADNGLIHRDVKPSNVLCAKDGRVLLADFGLAKTVGSRDDVDADGRPAPDGADNLTQRGVLVGTPAYMAPEQTGPGPIDHRADMYALGVTLYEMVTGQRPFSAPSTPALLLQHREEPPIPPRALAPDLTPALDALIVRLLSKDPAARFDTYAALREAIDGVRVRPVVSAGFFARSSAVAIDLLGSALVALPFLVLELGVLAWPAIALVWGIAEWRWAKTLGKRLFALRVVEAHDERPKLLRSLARNGLKYWGGCVVGVVNQELWGVSEAVINGIGLVIVVSWGAGLLLGAGKKKLALHDRLTKTRVIYDLGHPIVNRR